MEAKNFVITTFGVRCHYSTEIGHIMAISTLNKAGVSVIKLYHADRYGNMTSEDAITEIEENERISLHENVYNAVREK